MTCRIITQFLINNNVSAQCDIAFEVAPWVTKVTIGDVGFSLLRENVRSIGASEQEFGMTKLMWSCWPGHGPPDFTPVDQHQVRRSPISDHSLCR